MPDLARYGLALPLAAQFDDLLALKSVTAVTDLVLPATRDMLRQELENGVLCELAVHGVPPGLESQPAIVLEGGRAFTTAGAHAAQFLRRIAQGATGARA